MQLRWIRYTTGNWCRLLDLDLSQIREHGIYVIWHGEVDRQVICIGQGDIASRLATHRNNHRIMRHAGEGELYVTWAAVAPGQRDRVERTLVNRYSPLEGTGHPAALPVIVNGPWDWPFAGPCPWQEDREGAALTMR